MNTISNEGTEGAGDLPKVICRGLYPPASKAPKIPISLPYQSTTLLFLKKLFHSLLKQLSRRRKLVKLIAHLFTQCLLRCIILYNSINNDNNKVCYLMSKHIKRSDTKANEMKELR